MIHPGFVNDDVRRLSPWKMSREEEVLVFLEPQIAAFIAELQTMAYFK